MKTDFKYNQDVKKKKIIKNINIIPIPLYRCNVEIIFGKNTKQLETDWGNGMFFGGKTRDYLEDKSRSILITFPDNNPILSTVVHELCHATQIILKEAGHDYHEQEADEPFAYLLTYLVEEYLKIKKPLK